MGGILNTEPKKPQCGFLGGIFGIANKQAAKIERMDSLRVGTFVGTNGKIYTKISPKLDGRIEEIIDDSAIKKD